MDGMRVYLIGSLRSSRVLEVATSLRAEGFDVFDDWWSAGPLADEHWQHHEMAKGRTFREALAGEHARSVHDFDVENLMRSDAAVLVMPAGKSAHLELGYMAGLNRPTFILLEGEPERWDVMYRFASAVCYNVEELRRCLDVIRR